MTDTAPSSAAPAAPVEATQKPSIGILLLGIVFIICGMFAILSPLVSTLAMTLIAGVSLTAAGLAQIVQAFSRSWGGFFLHVLLGIIYVAGGIAFWVNPLAGALVITLVLGWVLIAQGIGEIILGFRVRPAPGWFLLIVAGIVSLLAGIWLLMRFPIAGLFVPGVILGFSLLVEGFAFVMIYFVGGKLPDRSQTTAP